MLRLFSDVKQSVMSVHTGEKLGTISQVVINMENLKIILFEISTGLQKKPLYLLPTDIRFSDNEQVIIDSHHSLSDSEELLRYKNHIKHNYILIGKPVVSTENKKIGKVSDFSYDDIHFFISKLYVKANFLHTLLYQSRIIDRNDIIETLPKKIIVKDTKLKKVSPKTLPVKSKA